MPYNVSMNAARWTADSIGRLCVDDLRQLRENALGLGAAEVVTLCDSAIGAQGTSTPSRRAPRVTREKTKLIPRRTAFEMCGANLNGGMSSWGAVRASDGTVVLSLWAEDIRREKGGGCSYLLWAPNAKGARAWSDTPAGTERLEHCKLAQERGGAEGFLVYGVRREGFLPEEQASSITGADPAVVIRFQVVLRGTAYWAVWGGKASSS